MLRHYRISTLFLLLGLVLYVPPSGAIGNDNPPTTETQTPDPAYAEGVKAVKAEKWTQAIQSFTAVVDRDPKNADAWNYLAFSYRKKGDLPKAFEYYDRALKLDPEHRGALEYLGEAYLQSKNLPKAQETLIRLQKLCQSKCEEYLDLQTAIQGYKP